MTATSAASSVPFPAAPAVRAPAVDFPLGWLLENAAPPIQYRATIEVARLQPINASAIQALPLGFQPALTLALTQGWDGSWGGAMLTVPSARAEHFHGVGTISATRRLLEYGWDRESPPLVRARRILFRLLALDEDPTLLFELGRAAGRDPLAIRRGRRLLREAAVATLAQAGYEKDPRLRGAAIRIADQLDAFLTSPLAAHPFVGPARDPQLAPDAAPPSIFALEMLAHMPLFRSERFETMERLFRYLSESAPRQAATLPPHLLLGDPLPSWAALEADLPRALHWLEVAGRLGFLRRNPTWERLYERLLDERDRDGVLRLSGGVPKSSNPYTWPVFPLEPHPTGEARWTDVNFRLGLIARAAGRGINPI